MIKIIFISDIVGKIGRKAVKEYLPKLKKQYHPDLVIANCENLAHGIGFTEKTLIEMKEIGVDFFTSGNHAWKKAGADEILNQPDSLVIRPANYSPKKSGLGFKEIQIKSYSGQVKKNSQNKLIVVNLLGKVFIKERVASPFKTMEKILKKAKDSLIIVDFHAEATSEKIAFASYFDGRVTAIIGTHTHVPTADEQILPLGTGYLTDAGMVGLKDSVIGASKEQIFNLFLKRGSSSKKHDLPEKGLCRFDAVYLELDERNKTTKTIKRINKLVNIKF